MSEKETACLRDITETDIMEYMQVEHPHNEKELWKMKHATPARIGIGLGQGVFAGCQTKNCGKLCSSSADTDLFRRRAVLAVYQGEHSGSVSNHKNGSGG